MERDGVLHRSDTFHTSSSYFGHEVNRYCPMQKWFITIVDSSLASLHPGNLGRVSEVSEVHAASTFRVEVIEICGFINAIARFGA